MSSAICCIEILANSMSWQCCFFEVFTSSPNIYKPVCFSDVAAFPETLLNSSGKGRNLSGQNEGAEIETSFTASDTRSLFVMHLIHLFSALLLSSKCCSPIHFIHQSLDKSRCETSLLSRSCAMEGEAMGAGGEFLLSRLLELK